MRRFPSRCQNDSRAIPSRDDVGQHWLRTTTRSAGAGAPVVRLGLGRWIRVGDFERRGRRCVSEVAIRGGGTDAPGPACISVGVVAPCHEGGLRSLQRRTIRIMSYGAGGCPGVTWPTVGCSRVWTRRVVWINSVSEGTSGFSRMEDVIWAQMVSTSVRRRCSSIWYDAGLGRREEWVRKINNTIWNHMSSQVVQHQSQSRVFGVDLCWRDTSDKFRCLLLKVEGQRQGLGQKWTAVDVTAGFESVVYSSEKGRIFETILLTGKELWDDWKPEDCPKFGCDIG